MRARRRRRRWSAPAARGVCAVCRDEESLIGGGRNTWLVVGRDPGRPGLPPGSGEPYLVAYLYDDTDGGEEVTVTRAPRPADRWHVVAGDGTGCERHLTPAVDGLAGCVEAVADWAAGPVPARH